MGFENITWQVEEGLGTLTFNRPKALNALNRVTIGEMGKVLDEVERGGVRALVLTGAGDKAFVAGADIAEMASLGPEEARAFADLGQKTFARLERLAIPTVAAVNGFALGGGCELAMACDLIYASDKARFGQPEVNLGLIPGFGGTQRLTRRVGLMRAKEMIFTADFYGAETARAMGLVLEVLPPEKLLEHARGQARKIAGKGPLAVAAAKRVMEAGASGELGAACALERDGFAGLFASADAAEGMKAFTEKRPARFTGK
jgi:enoyl-CoA hydratase